MLRLSRTLFLIGLLAGMLTTAASAAPVATLVTVGPGDEIWEKFGHNMIRLQDDEQGFDVCYNWGLFDFDKPNFIVNFVRGRPVYTMAALRTRPQLEEYQAQNRRVTFQTLSLTPEQLNALIVRCETNRRPENADYRYDYFKDNCSTRVRDTLDAALGGALAKATRGVATSPPVTLRFEMTRLTQGPFWTSDFWLCLGMDFALGPNGDKPLDVWGDCFLPATVSAAATPFTAPSTELWTSTRPPPPAAPPTRWPGLLLIGVVGAAAISLARDWTRRLLIGGWWIVSGFGGAFMLFMWVATDHVAAHANQNLWHFSPLAWVALGAVVIRKRRAAGRLATLIAALSLAGVLVLVAGRLGGPLAQANGPFILLALPINLATAWAGRSALPTPLTKPAAADEVAGL